MKCSNCGFRLAYGLVKFEDKNGIQSLCLNCCIIKEMENALILENNEDFICEVSNKKGAVKYTCGNEVYILDKEIMHRLIRRHLKPEEYLKLSSNRTELTYMIHDDFYTEDGTALQPVDD
jgi:hypothetical protein